MAAEPVDYKRLCRASDLSDHFTGHFEVETYAWGVIPSAFRRPSLVDDISKELEYFESVANDVYCATRTSS